MNPKIRKLVIFASGAGTNFEVIASKCREGKINGKVVLLVTDNPKARAIVRAKKLKIPFVIINPKKFKSSADWDKKLVSVCKKYKADLICLAGYLLKIGPCMLKAFPNRILNIHPALLPSFGGKGFYGDKIFKRVLASGVKISGVSVHFVNAKYDNGPIVLQKELIISADETPKSLAEKTHKIEHELYPKVVELFCEDRLKVSGSRVKILPPKKTDKKIKTALISVSDKTGLVEFAKKLEKLGIEIISTSGTAELLRKNNIKVTPLESLTGFGEMLSGRVKTLHPSVHAGILFDRENKNHLKQISDLNIKPIDMVVVNLYPFEKTFKKENKLTAKATEQIDIGGVTLVRAAAKNFEFVTVVCDVSDYDKILQEIKNEGIVCHDMRKNLASKVFVYTAGYDFTVSSAFGNTDIFPQKLNLQINKISDLRYGENPHQESALYSAGELSFKKLHGRELSYNNLLDASAAWSAVLEFKRPSAVIVKHLTPCGIAENDNLPDAFNLAWTCDPLSAFGGIIALNRKVDYKTAKLISKYFVEVVIAPDFDRRALAVLKKKKNLRLLEKSPKLTEGLLIRSAGSEILVSTADDKLLDKLQVVTKTKITKEQIDALIFALKAVKHIKSNAIVLTSKNATLGIGAGQMSRVDAVKMAGLKYGQYLKHNKKPKTLVMASDAFFPFDDAIKEAKKFGVSAIIQPGGSVRDKEIVKTCNKLGIAMVFTGTRHFRH